MSGILEGVDLRTRLAGQNRMELLLFRLGGRQLHGINVFKVKEVVQCPPLTQLPESHHTVCGIASLRGRTVSVIDLSLALGGPAASEPASRFVIVSEYNHSVQGFLVDSVDRIVNTTWEEVLPPPAGVTEDCYVNAVTRVDDELVEILDVESVLAGIMDIDDDPGRAMEGLDFSGTDAHVLVADDSAMARRHVARILGKIGVEFTVVPDGRQALDRLRGWLEAGRDLKRSPVLVLSDIEMPGMDGYSLTRAIREDPRLQSLPVILHTSLSGTFNRQMVSQVGADEFLPKWEPANLARLLVAYLGDHPEVDRSD